MANIDKDKLNKVFRLTDKEDIYDFLAEEVYKNASLAKKVIKRFLPDDTDCCDFRQEVQDVFIYADESNRRYGSSRDWHQIEHGLWRMLEKALYLRGNGKNEDAADIACQIISSVGKEYTRDSVFEDTSYDGDNFCTDNCVDLLIDLLESDVLDPRKIKSIEKEIRKASKMETYTGYCICDFKMLLCVLEGETKSKEEHLKILDEKIASTRSSYDRNKWIMRKSSYLQRKGTESETEAMTEANFGVPEISKRIIDKQIKQGKIDDALESIGKALECTPYDEYSYIRECHLQRVHLAESQGNAELQIEDYTYLVRHASGETEMYEHYLCLKRLLPEEEFKKVLRAIILELIGGNMMFVQKGVARILSEERETELLCQCLSYNDSWNNTEGYETFKEYGSALSPQEREEVVQKHIAAIREMATYAGYKDYSSIRYQMELLLDCCDEARTFVDELKEEFRETYRRRRAFMKQLDRIK